MSDIVKEEDWGDIAELFEDYTPQKKEKSAEPVPLKKEDEIAQPKKVSEDDEEQKAWVKKAKEKREEAFRTVKETAESLFKDKSHTKLADYLMVQARFPDYTVSNCLLISAQRPESTVLKSIDGWKSCEERMRIKTGTKGITILEPGEEFVRRDGSVGRYYNTRTLFDISQINGIDLDVPVDNTAFNDKLAILFHVTKAFRINIYSHTDETRAVLYQPNQIRMYINKSADRSIVYYQLLIELAHSILSENNDYSRPKYGFICQMIGFILCILTNEGSSANDILDCFDVPQEYQNLKRNDVVGILDIVKRTSHEIYTEYRKQLKKYNQNKKSEG